MGLEVILPSSQKMSRFMIAVGALAALAIRSKAFPARPASAHPVMLRSGLDGQWRHR
jgi:hypothetical protein